MIACIISAEWATFPGSVIFKHIVTTKCHYESPNGGSHHYSGQQNLFCGITSGCCSNLARNQKVAATCEELLQKVVLLLAKKSVHVYLAHFTGPVYGMTQSNYDSLFTQLIFLNMHLIAILSVSAHLFHFFRRHDLHYLLYIFSK